MSYMRDAAGRRLDSFKSITLGAPDPTIVWLGDSHTANGGGFVGDAYNSLGFWCHAQSLTNHTLQSLANHGVAGETTTQILARVGATTALNPGWCHVLAGTNDITAATPLATIKANLAAIWDALDAAGIRVIAGTIPPRSSYGGGQMSDTLNLNTWIMNQARVRANLIVVDYFSALCRQGQNVFGQDMTTDGLHMSASGASYAGLLLANTLRPKLAGTPGVLGILGGNLLPNGHLANGGAGAVPTGWLWTGTAPTYSRVSRTDGVNNINGPGWQRIVKVDGSGAGVFQTNTNNMIGISVGDSVVGTIRYRASGLNQAAGAHEQFLYLRIGAYNGSSFINWVYDLYHQAGYGNQSRFDREGVLRTPPLVVPSGTTQLALQVQIGEGGTYDFADAGAYNLTTQSIVR